MAKKLKRSPKGKAIFPHLNKADFKFKKEYGEYHVKLRADANDPEAVAAKIEIDAAMKQALAEAKEKYATELRETTDKEKLKQLKKQGVPEMADAPYSEDDEDNTIDFTYKMAAGGKNSKTGEIFSQFPALFDAKLKDLPRDTKIGGGSILRVSHELTTFYTPAVGAGASLRMRAVQVLELREYSADAKALGFAEEEGFETEDTTAAAAAGLAPEGQDDEPEEIEDKVAAQADVAKKGGKKGGKAGDDF